MPRRYNPFVFLFFLCCAQCRPVQPFSFSSGATVAAASVAAAAVVLVTTASTTTTTTTHSNGRMAPFASNWPEGLWQMGMMRQICLHLHHKSHLYGAATAQAMTSGCSRAWAPRWVSRKGLKKRVARSGAASRPEEQKEMKEYTGDDNNGAVGDAGSGSATALNEKGNLACWFATLPVVG